MKEERKEGYTWHMYHNHLMTYCFDYEWRVEDIRRNKPKKEVEERLKRFRCVKGALPSAFDGVRDSFRLSRLLEGYKEEINALHEEECRGCPWNGEELVFLRRKRMRKVWRWIKKNVLLIA